MLAVASAQVFGAGRDFLCRCSGATVITLADHCEGLHDGVACQRVSGCTHENDGGNGGDVERHDGVQKSFQGSQETAHAPVAAFTPVLIATLPCCGATAPCRSTGRSAWGLDRLSAGPPPAIMAARTVVLLI